MKVEKDRYFTFLIYPDGEGLPQDWKERLETLGVPIAISPLHDKDKAKGGGFKKAHYHGIYIANNPVTADSVYRKIKRRLSSELSDCKAIAKVKVIDKTVENVYLYLTHESKDAIQKGKYIYDKKDIIHINNFDVERYITIDVEIKHQTLKTLLEIIRAYGIPNVIDLHDFIEQNGEAYGIDLKLFLSTIEAKSSILRLYFDGAYQRGQRRLAEEREKQLLASEKVK